MPYPGSNGDGSADARRDFSEGDPVKGTVKAVNDFGVFLDVGAGKEAFLPWKQVLGSSPGAGDVIDAVVSTVDDKGRLTLVAPGGKGQGRGGGFGGKGRGPNVDKSGGVGGFIYDVEQGVRRRRKGGKGDGQGAYTYPDGMPLSELLPEDDVSGHLTNIEREGCWIDIGATKDAYLSWEDGPKVSLRWQVGELVDDLKIRSVSGQDIRLKWDDEGISCLTDKEWEKLFAAGPCVPKQKEEDEGLTIGDNCCAIYGNARSPAVGSTAKARTAEQEQQPQQPRAVLVEGRAVEEPGRAAERGGRGRGRAGGRGLLGRAEEGIASGKGAGGGDATGGAGGEWGGKESGKARGRGRGGMDSALGKGASGDAAANAGGGAKGWGKGEGPAFETADAYGSCAQSAEARARSAPPPRRQRLRPIEDVSIGEVVRGRVVGLSRAGALVDFGCAVEGLVPRALVTTRCRKGQVIARLNVMGVDVASGRVTLEPLDDE